MDSDAVDTSESEETKTVVIQDRRAPNPYRRPFLTLVLIISASLFAQAFASWQTWTVAHDTNTIVKDVEFENSPEAKEAQEAYLEEIILRVDCNSRKAIEEALNDISIENPEIVFDINITSERCGNTDSADPEPEE